MIVLLSGVNCRVQKERKGKRVKRKTKRKRRERKKGKREEEMRYDGWRQPITFLVFPPMLYSIW